MSLLGRVQHFQPLSQSIFIPSKYGDVDRKKDQARPYLNHLSKKTTIAFIRRLLGATV